jgi:hypothetical protein
MAHSLDARVRRLLQAGCQREYAQFVNDTDQVWPDPQDEPQPVLARRRAAPAAPTPTRPPPLCSR